MKRYVIAAGFAAVAITGFTAAANATTADRSQATAATNSGIVARTCVRTYMGPRIGDAWKCY